MARLFDGVDDYLENTPAPVTASPFTVAGWFRTSNMDDLQDIWAVSNGGATNKAYRCQANGPETTPVADTFRYNATSGPNSFTDTTTGYSSNVWHHFAAVEASATDRRAFIDGGSKGTSDKDRTPAGIDTTRIGALSTFLFDGDLAHIAVWNVVLSDAEIASLYGGRISPLRFRRDALISYWAVGGQSPEPDIVGGINLTLFSAPAQSEEPPIPWSIICPG